VKERWTLPVLVLGAAFWACAYTAAVATVVYVMSAP
jgi:hypothetical protein